MYCCGSTTNIFVLQGFMQKVRTCRRTHQVFFNDSEILVFSCTCNSLTCTRSRDSQSIEIYHQGSKITHLENAQKSQGLKPQGRIPSPQTHPLPWQDLCSHSLTPLLQTQKPFKYIPHSLPQTQPQHKHNMRN